MLAPRRSHGIAAALLFFMALASAACQPSATVAPTTVPTTDAEAPATPEEMEAMRARGEWGLRADLEHVRAVAADPLASEYLTIQMLPSEIAEMQARAANADAVRAIVQAESDAAPNDFCGFYLDQQNGGAVTSMWKANLLIHEAAIRSKVQPTARLAFRTCRFTQAELQRVCELLNADDQSWMAEIPALATGWDCGTADNFIGMDISSAVPNAAERVLRHYTDAFGLPPGILVVRSDGNGARLVPWGTVLVTVLGPDGKPVGLNGLSLHWFGDVDGLQCGGGDVGYGVSEDDKPTELPCQEGTWTIQVVDLPDPDAGGVVYGSIEVNVARGVATHVTFRLKQAPPTFRP